MKIQISAQLIDGEFVPVNTRGMEEADIELTDINTLSSDKELRLVGINKSMYRLTLKSYKEVKKALAKLGNARTGRKAA